MSTDTPPATAKPSPCRVCGGRAGVEHITEGPRPDLFAIVVRWGIEPMAPPPRRYAQVICRICDTRGPRVLFVAGEEWPHIAAECAAVEDWNGLHRMTQCI